MTVRITCINKSEGNHQNPHEAISYYGWLTETRETGKSDRQTMVNWVKDNNQAYVIDGAGAKVYCYVNRSANGTEFLQTQSDGRFTNNLLSLPECK